MPQRRNVLAENRARERRYRERGWKSYGQYRYWAPRLTDAKVMELAEEIGGPVEPERRGSLMSRRANAIVNPQPPPHRDWDWRVRLLKAAGRI